VTQRWLVLVLCGLVWVGCARTQGGIRGDLSQPVSDDWSDGRAMVVLQRGIDSEDPTLRTAAFIAWFSSGDRSAEKVVLRAANDPSPIVQRALAKRFPERFSTPLQSRAAPDPMALAWLAFAGQSVACSGQAIQCHLIRALQGDEPAQRQLLARIEDGDVPADSGFFELLSMMKLEGLGRALLTGVEFAEAEVRISMALAAFSNGEAGAEKTLTSLLDSAEDPADHFWAIEALVRGRISHAMDWLKQGRKSSDHARALYFRVALASFGEEGLGVVLEAIKTGDRDTRAWAIECLGLLPKDRPLPREMIAILQGSARDETGRIRLVSARVIADKFGLKYVPLVRLPMEAEPDPAILFIAGKSLEEGIKKGP